MRIALLTRRFDPAGGGTERDLMVTADALLRAGHEVTIYAGEVRGPAGSLKVRAVGGPPLGRALSLIRFACGAAPQARREGAELVLSFARAVDADVLRSGGGAHVSYVQSAWRWRSTLSAAAMWMQPYQQAQMFIERRGFRSPRLKKAIAVSNLVRDDLIRVFGLPRERAVTLYNGVDLNRFRPERDPGVRAEVRARFNIPRDAAVVAFVGNGFARKGLRFLIEAWPAVAGKPYLLVVGADRALNRYRARAEALGMRERIIFAGPQPGVERIFAAADALALPSLFEPFGNVALEAMASGLPVLTSSMCGVAELVPPEMRAYVVERPDDAGEIALRLSAMLDSHAALGRTARAAAEQYPWSRYADELNALIASLA
jgi:UDP-glucose:(heptosyl)LPS alpha-1,3-glucosyltransferase